MPEIPNSCHNEPLIVPFLASLSLVPTVLCTLLLLFYLPKTLLCCLALSSSPNVSMWGLLPWFFLHHLKSRASFPAMYYPVKTCLNDWYFFQTWSHCGRIIILIFLTRQFILEPVSESQIYLSMSYMVPSCKYVLNKWAPKNEYYITYIPCPVANLALS